MGVITIFSVDDCVHCTRLLGALNDQEIPCTEISLSTHPHRRTDMLSLSDRLTVPQVFFNERHVGGADDTFHELESWLMDLTKTVQEHFHDEVASKPDPTDPRLMPSTEAPVEVSKPPTRPKSDRIILPDKRSVCVVTMTEKLKRILPCEVNDSKLKICKQSFTGAQAVKALSKEYKLSEDEAVKFGEYLRKAKLFHSVYNSVGEFCNNEKCIYRLQAYHTPDILNSYRVWTTVVESDYMSLLRRLKLSLDKLEKEVANGSSDRSSRRSRSRSSSPSSGRSEEINPALVKGNKHFPIFEEAVCELQRVDLAKLDGSATKAFGVNVYNLMIKYAFLKFGIGSSSRSRSAFFNGVKFNIGNETFSFQDWEHGFLRGNRKAPYSLKAQFGRKDPRQACALPEVDCRIHFALNCGAKSCPPMRTFTADGIEEELRIVSQAFCEDDDNVEINVKKRSLCVSKIWSWYRVDFVSSERELPAKIVEYLRGDKRAKLQQLLDDGKPIRISYKEYDWSNGSDFEPFDSAVLRADVQRIVPRFKFRSDQG